MAPVTIALTLVNISVIVICNSLPLPDDMLESAKDEGMIVIRTKKNQLTVPGKTWELLNKEQTTGNE